MPNNQIIDKSGSQSPVALVTGSSRGVGLGIAKHLLSQGYRVAGCSRGPSTLDREGYEHSQVDVGCADQVWKWVTGVARSHDGIDVVVNSAGILPPISLAMATSSDVVEATVRTNFLGVFSVCREAAKVMQKRKYGRIINISTIAVNLHMEGASAYLASKSAMVEFSKVLAKELGSTGVTVNVVAISLLETEMSAGLTEESRERYLNSFAIKRWATIEDVCNVVSFFASPDSSYITGQEINLGYVA